MDLSVLIAMFSIIWATATATGLDVIALQAKCYTRVLIPRYLYQVLDMTNVLLYLFMGVSNE